HTVADMLYKVMAVKDEYEVARLYADPAFQEKLAAQFTNPKKLKVLLAPPFLSRRLDPKTGRPQKIAFGPWIFTAFRVLAKFKGLRGTFADVFGKTPERRMERALREDYCGDVERLIGLLGTAP